MGLKTHIIQHCVWKNYDRKKKVNITTKCFFNETLCSFSQCVVNISDFYRCGFGAALKHKHSASTLSELIGE